MDMDQENNFSDDAQEHLLPKAPNTPRKNEKRENEEIRNDGQENTLANKAAPPKAKAFLPSTEPLSVPLLAGDNDEEENEEQAPVEEKENRLVNQLKGIVYEERKVSQPKGSTASDDGRRPSPRQATFFKPSVDVASKMTVLLRHIYNNEEGTAIGMLDNDNQLITAVGKFTNPFGGPYECTAFQMARLVGDPETCTAIAAELSPAQIVAQLQTLDKEEKQASNDFKIEAFLEAYIGAIQQAKFKETATTSLNRFEECLKKMCTDKNFNVRRLNKMLTLAFATHGKNYHQNANDGLSFRNECMWRVIGNIQNFLPPYQFDQWRQGVQKKKPFARGKGESLAANEKLGENGALSEMGMFVSESQYKKGLLFWSENGQWVKQFYEQQEAALVKIRKDAEKALGGPGPAPDSSPTRWCLIM